MAAPSTARRPPAAPRLPPDGEPARVTAEDLGGGATLDAVRIVDGDLGGVRVRVRGLSLLDVEIVRGSLANLDARSSSMVRVAASESRLTGLGWSEGRLQDVAFHGCRVDLASFRFSQLERVTFTDCVLREADFEEVRFASVAFHHCDLTGASFANARFTRSELRRCTLDDLQGVDGLRGAALEWGDILSLAGAFAAALGVRLLDDDAQ
jgi:uncharacterized protein YjbI with pentapeptide repeats